MIEYWIEGYKNLDLNLYESVIISKQLEGNVYLYEELGVVVKERMSDSLGNRVCNICIRREFDVGVLVNQYNSRHLVKTLGYFERDDNSYVVTEYVDGISLHEFIITRSSEEVRDVLLDLFEVIKQLQEEMDFTHYDLHTGNVIVEIGNRNNIKLIDLSRSHVRGVRSAYSESPLFDEVITPGLFDPIFDYILMMGILYRSYDIVNSEVLLMFDKNNIDTSQGYGYPIVADKYEGRDLVSYDKIWASIIPNDMTMREVHREHAKVKLAYLIDNGIDITEFEDQYLDELEPHLTPETDEFQLEKIAELTFIGNYPQLESFDHINEEYIKMLGRAAVHDKLMMLKSMDDVETVRDIIIGCIQEHFQ